jgi:hypothetical protein
MVRVFRFTCKALFVVEFELRGCYLVVFIYNLQTLATPNTRTQHTLQYIPNFPHTLPTLKGDCTVYKQQPTVISGGCTVFFLGKHESDVVLFRGVEPGGACAWAAEKYYLMGYKNELHYRQRY